MKKPQFSLGVEVGESFFRLALLETNSSHVLALEHFDVSAYPLRDTGQLEEKLAEWVQRVPEPPHSITFTVSAGQSQMRRVILPAEVDDVREYLRWEFSTSLSSSPDEYIFDFHLERPAGKGSRQALVVGLRRAWIDSLVSGFHRKGLLPTQIELDAFSLANLLEQENNGPISDGTAVVKAEREGILLYLFKDGLPESLRWISTLNVRSAFGGPSQAHVMAILAKEVQGVLSGAAFCIGQPVGTPRKVYLCGSLSLFKNFVQTLQAIEGVDLEIWQNFRKFTLDAAGTSTVHLARCAAALGAALRREGDKK